MSERIETLIREYPKKKRDLECLKRQIADFKGITDEDMIDAQKLRIAFFEQLIRQLIYKQLILQIFL